MTTEAEYHGVVNVGTEAIWIQQLLGEIRFPIEASTVLHYDNKSATYVIDDLVAHSRMNHVELHCNYLRQLVQEKVVTLFYCRTDDHIVDIFIKPLSEVNFIKFHTLHGI